MCFEISGKCMGEGRKKITGKLKDEKPKERWELCG
jgi:hypothetical protein